MDIMDQFEETEFDGFSKFKNKTTKIHGYVYNCFGICFNPDNNTWTIVHLPTGVRLSTHGFLNILHAMETVLEICTLRNDWQIDLDILTQEEDNKFREVYEKRLGGLSLNTTPNKNNKCPTPLNGMTY